MGFMSFLQGVERQINPLDNNATFKNPQGNGSKASTVTQAKNLGMGFLKGAIQPFREEGNAIASVPAALAREYQGPWGVQKIGGVPVGFGPSGKPISDIQQNVFGTTNQGSIARKIIGNSAQIGLTVAAPDAAGATSSTLERFGVGGVTNRLATGAITGAVGGAPYNVANTISDPNQKLTPGSIAKSAAVGAGTGALLGGATSAAIEFAKLPKQTQAAIDEQASKASGLKPENVINQNEAGTLRDWASYQKGNEDNIHGSQINQLAMQARNAAKTAGIDVTSGSADDIASRIEEYISKLYQHNQARDSIASGGYVSLGKDQAGSIAKSDNSQEIKKSLDGVLPSDAIDKVAPAATLTKDPNIVQNLVDKNKPFPLPEPPGKVTDPNIRQALDLATQKTDTGSISVDTNAKNFKGLASDVRGAFSGEVNAQKQSAANLADVLKKAAPDEQHGIFWYREAGGDATKLESWLNSTDPKLEQFKPEIQQALNLSPQAKQVSSALDEYYNKIGQNAYEQGSLKGVLTDYNNKRLYQQTDTPKGIGQALSQYTSSSKQRVYPDVTKAIEDGHIPASTNAADLAAVHGSELARANATRNLADNMAQFGAGAYVEPGKIPQGWTDIPSLSKGSQTFVAPAGLAKGLKAITQPDFLSNVDSLRGLAKYQGLVKTVDLSFSLFHHITLLAQGLYQTKLGTSLIGKTDQILSLKNPDFAALENDFVKNTGITTKVSDVQDVMRGLVGNEEKGVYGKVSNIPGIKQALDLADKSASLLFDKGQRWLKVNDYGTKVTDWIGKHPNATNEEVTAAKQGFAREVNAAYGGLNWQALGVSKTEQSMLRTVLFAPDWTVSNIELARQLLPKAIGGVGGTASSAARSHIFTALAGGLVATEALNKAITGHFTNENPKGHKYEIEVAPNVYVSVFRGGIGDITKLAGNIQDKGIAQGTAQFAQGKTTPLVRTAIGLGSGTQFTGQPITNPNDNFGQKVLGEAKYIGQSATPVPLGVTATAKYVNEAQKTHQPVNPLVAATLGSGIGRYSQSSNGLSNRQQAYIQQLTKQGASKDQVNGTNQFFLTLKQTAQDRTKADKAITAALVKGDTGAAQKAAQDYNKKLSQSFQGWVKKYSKYSTPELVKAYKSNKINLTSTSINARIKSIKSNPLYNATLGG